MKDLVVAIDLGSKNIKIVAATKTEHKTPVILVATSETTQGMRYGQIVNFDEVFYSLQKAIKKTEKHLGKNISRVILGLNSIEIKTEKIIIKQPVSKSNNEVTEFDIEKAEQELSQKLGIDSPYEILNKTLSQVFLDDKKIEGSVMGKIGTNLEFHFLANLISKKNLEQYLELFEKLNIEVYEILFGTFADTIPLTSKKERMYGGCLVNIGADNTTVTIFENEMPALTKILKIGGSNITNDIAIGLNISLEEAEDIKKKNRAANKKIVDNIVHARLKDICELIRIEILKVSRVGKLTGGIVLTGGSAKIENIDEVFKKILDMNVKNASNIMPKLTDGILRDGIFSTAYGLTFLSSKEEKVSAKFYRKTKAFGRKILQVILP